MKKRAIVDTLPSDARGQGSINLGLELVAKEWDADILHWTDKADVSQYEQIGFNVFYPPHIFNIAPFLTRNGISPLKSERLALGKDRTKIYAGGQGVGLNNILYNIVDEIFYGEADGQEFDEATYSELFWRAEKLISPCFVRNKKAVIELTRGCKYRCKFCEYGHIWGGKYREKDIEEVKAQIDWCLNAGVRRGNFMSANLAGYSELDELVEYCIRNNFFILNSDICLADFEKIEPLLEKTGVALPKVGVESFSEKCRYQIGKKISDEKLEKILRRCIEMGGGFHLYLIYGLPNDDYSKWFSWLDKLGGMLKEHTGFRTDLFGERVRENSKNVTIDLSITNFEPVKGTPLENAPEVDFKEKDKFLEKWTRGLIESRLVKADKLDYGNCKGRMGRVEPTYKMLMALKKRGPEITDAIIKVFPNGVRRSIPRQKSEEFLSLLDKTTQ